MKEDLKSIRNNANITQQEAADYLNVSLRSYKSYENETSKRDTIKYDYFLSKMKELNFVDENHGILSLNDIKFLSQGVLKKYPVHYCYLFGSYAKSNAREDSDIDLLISTDLKGLEFYGLVEDLSNTFKKKVDVIDLGQLQNNMELLNEILKNGIKIYG